MATGSPGAPALRTFGTGGSRAPAAGSAEAAGDDCGVGAPPRRGRSGI